MYNNYRYSPSSTFVVFCRTQLSRIAISCPHAIDPTSNNKLMAIQSISLLHRRASIIKNSQMSRSITWLVTWRSVGPLIFSAISRREIGDFSPRNRREIIVVWTVPISRREIIVMWTGHNSPLNRTLPMQCSQSLILVWNRKKRKAWVCGGKMDVY